MAVTERVTLQEITAATVRDSRWQKRGYGSAALELLIDHARTLPGVTRLRTSYVPSANSASGLYERRGFRATGEMDEGEVVMELPFDRAPGAKA